MGACFSNISGRGRPTTRATFIIPEADFASLEESVIVNFHSTDLLIEKGRPVYSPPFKCKGNEWRLKIYPGGHSQSRDGMFGAFLYPMRDTEIVASYRICLLKSDGAIYKTHEGKNQSFGYHFLLPARLGAHNHKLPCLLTRIRAHNHKQVLLTIFSTTCLMMKEWQMLLSK